MTIGDHRLVLQEVDPGTELHVSRVGEPDEHDIEIDEGWVTFLEQLRYVVTVQPTGARHTLMVPGAPATDIPWEHEERARSTHHRTVLVPEWGQVRVAIV